MKKAKPFEISKEVVVEAWKHVKANQGAAGVDHESIADFERNLKNNLYRIWNRMTSGSYFPLPVKTVAIPKKTGGERILGIPSVSDRVAQMVTKLNFEPMVNYYGSFYKSALYPTLQHLNNILVRWARRKFKRLKSHLTRAVYWLGRIAKRQPQLFPHWQFGIRPTAG